MQRNMRTVQDLFRIPNGKCSIAFPTKLPAALRMCGMTGLTGLGGLGGLGFDCGMLRNIFKISISNECTWVPSWMDGPNLEA